MPIILVQNEVTVEGHAYSDRTGVVYHFPNVYRSRFIEGDTFIYYRGERRLGGGRRPAEYFGSGVVGTVWQDPATHDLGPRDRKWFAELRSYEPFPAPVMARQDDGYIEVVVGQGHWRNSVRRVGPGIAERIMVLAFGQAERFEIAPDSFTVPSPRPLALVPVHDELKSRGNIIGSARRSLRSSIVGMRGEEVSWSALQRLEGSTCHRWCSTLGEYPGYDMSYVDQNGILRGVEVKSSAGITINSVELTANEWEAAVRMGAHYAIGLVLDCLSAFPRIEMIEDPYFAFGHAATPTQWILPLRSR